MSFLLFAVATAAAAATASYLALRRDREDEDETDGDRASDPEAADDGAPPGFEDLPLTLRDVVQVQGQERWLSGALVAREGDHVVAVLFFAPEGAKTESVLAFAEPRREIYWLSPVSGVLHGADPPTTIELSRILYRRRGRRPVELEVVGQGVPSIGPTAILAEYEGGGRSVAVVVRAQETSLTFTGQRHEPGEYDVLGGGGDGS